MFCRCSLAVGTLTFASRSGPRGPSQADSGPRRISRTSALGQHRVTADGHRRSPCPPRRPGYLTNLYDGDTRPVRTVVDDRETASQITTELGAAAPELREFDEQSGLGPERINRIEVGSKRESPPTPDEWDEQENEWENALQEVSDDAEMPRSKGSLVTKTIDGRDYYYLQWREGDTVTSQYVAPVSLAR